MRIKIVSDVRKDMEGTNKYVREVMAGKRDIDPARAEHTMVMTPEIFSKVFTPQRIRLLIRVKNNDINNIYQIAKDLKRPYEAVHRDIKYLQGLNIIKIKKRDRERIPVLNEKLTLPVFGA